MYLEHFGLQEIPFRITPQVEHFYAGAQRGALLEALLFAVNHDEGIMVVSGEVGVGKTMLCRMLIERLPEDVLMIYVGNPSLSPRELIETIAIELGLQTEAGTGLLRAVERRLIELYAEGRRVVAVIDEAHAMPNESLEQVRLLSNLETATRKLLQIVLFGQPELDTILASRNMRSLRERITQYFRLQPLTRHEVREYLDFRLRAAGYKGPNLFGEASIRLLTKASRGLIRRVNILADKTLTAAFATNTHSTTTKHVRAAIRDSSYARPLRQGRLRQIGYGIAAAIAGLVLGAYFWGIGSVPPRVAPPSPVNETPPPVHRKTPETSTPAPLVAESVDVPDTNTSAATPSPVADTLRYAPVPDELGPLAREVLARSRQDIEGIPSDHWFLQLRSIQASSAGSLEGFIAAASRSNEAQLLRLYVARNDPKRHVGVIYGDYATLQQAHAALAGLPSWIKGSSAFPRRFQSLR